MIFCVSPLPHFSLFSLLLPATTNICTGNRRLSSPVTGKKKRGQKTQPTRALFAILRRRARMLLLVVVSKHNAFTYNEEEEEDPLEIFFRNCQRQKLPLHPPVMIFLSTLPCIFGETGRGVGEYARKCNNETNFFL